MKILLIPNTYGTNAEIRSIWLLSNHPNVWIFLTLNHFSSIYYIHVHLHGLMISSFKDLLEYAAMHFNNNQQSSSIYKSLLLLPFAKCKFGQTSRRERESSRKHRAQKAWTLPVRSGYYDVDSVKQQVIGPIFILLTRFK